jgi:hypothetical protein
MKSPNKKGYVYILTNPTMPGIVKIGKTTREPEARLKELNSATGVAMPFKLEMAVETNNPSLTERIIHEHLTDNRINKRREFFKVTVKRAISVARYAATQTSGRVYRRKKVTKKKSKYLAQLSATLAILTWISMFSASATVGAAIICIWSILTRTPKTLWEFLTFPSFFGRYSIIAVLLLSVYPLTTGEIDASKFTIHSLQNEFQQMISIGTR